MKIAIDDEGPAARVTMTGRLDLSGAEVIALPLATLSGSKDALYLDMAGVTFLASIGLRYLVTTAKTMARRGGRLVLLNPNAAVTEVIELAGLAGLLPVENAAQR